MIKEEIKNLIYLSVKNLRLGDFNMHEIIVVIPENKAHGEYATNAPFVIASKLKRDVREISELLKKEIEKIKDPRVEKIEAVGFVNFYLTKDFFIENIKKIDKDFGKNQELKNKKIIIDYTDPNPFKEFHIGHLMSNAIGESLSRIFEFQGAKVKRVCYQGDVGMHVANVIAEKLWSQKGDEIGVWVTGLSSTATAYVGGIKRSKEDPKFAEFVKKVNQKIYNRTDSEINKLYDSGKELSLRHFDEIYKKLGTKFDYFIFESQTGDIGKKIVEEGLKDGVFEKGDNGAVIFKGEKYGLHTRVFISSEGLPTYEAKDLGLAEIKYKKYHYDKSFIVTGNEVNEYFKVMLCAMKEVSPKLAEKTKHIGHGMMKLLGGNKISSRRGRVITAEDLFKLTEELVSEKIKDRELSEKEKTEIVEAVAIGAIRYSILKHSIGSDIIYDPIKSISFNGDSGPYLQYSYTRAKSVLRKAKEEGIKLSFKKASNEITQLEKSMSYFPEVVLQAGENYEPHYLVLYLTELAGIFNNYYAKNKIVDKKDELSPYKVALTNAFATVMKNGLWLLGIKSLDKM